MPLSALWEQWGLLGLLVGVAVAFGGFFVGAPDDGGAMLNGAADLVERALEEVPVVEEALMEDQTQLASTDAVVMELVSLEASIGAQLGAWAGRAGLAGAFGVIFGFVGLLAGGAGERTKRQAPDEWPSYTGVGDFTPGTIRSEIDRASAEQEATQEERPMSAVSLALRTFQLEWRQLLAAAGVGNSPVRRHVPSFVPSLVLSNQAVLARERERPEVPTPPPVRIAYDLLCWFIDVVFEDRPIQRFWFLETVARMPYFAYISGLHLYETLGWWRSPELRAVHAAEEDNELHHLLIMESLGGDQRWSDRFLAQHGAIAYYWTLIAFFVIDPRWSYNFSRLIEAHAVDTYGEFVDANAERLKTIPPPPIAVEYYRSGDLYMFDKFQTARVGLEPRRPPCSTLYDVFKNICDDEEQHVLTMQACEEWVVGGSSPVALGFNRLSQEKYEEEVTLDDNGRAAWVAWGNEVSAASRATITRHGHRPATASTRRASSEGIATDASRREQLPSKEP